MKLLAMGKRCTSSKTTRESRTLRFTPRYAVRYLKNSPMSWRYWEKMLSTSLGAVSKLMMRWLAYSFAANAWASVVFPVRRAPSMRRADSPLPRFHSSMRAYAFRLNMGHLALNRESPSHEDITFWLVNICSIPTFRAVYIFSIPTLWDVYNFKIPTFWAV